MAMEARERRTNEMDISLVREWAIYAVGNRKQRRPSMVNHTRMSFDSDVAGREPLDLQPEKTWDTAA